MTNTLQTIVYNKTIWDDESIFSCEHMNNYYLNTLKKIKECVALLEASLSNDKETANNVKIKEIKNIISKIPNLLQTLKSATIREKNYIVIDNAQMFFLSKETRLYLANNITFTISYKNKDKTYIKYAYSKKNTTLKTNKEISFDTKNTMHTGYKKFYYFLFDLDTNYTSTMSMSDLKKFCEVTNISGIGEYYWDLEIDNNKLYFVLSLLGGGLFFTRKRGTVTLKVINNSKFIAYL